MGVCGSKEKDPRRRFLRKSTEELALAKPEVVEASMGGQPSGEIGAGDIHVKQEDERKERHKIYNTGVLRWSREYAVQEAMRSKERPPLPSDEVLTRFVKRLQLTDPQDFGDFQVNSMTIGSAYLEDKHHVVLNDMESCKQVVYNLKGKITQETRRLKFSSKFEA